jgi:polyisoprenoid-binding protein YceI
MSTMTTTLIPAGTYNVDPSHSRLEFAVKHLGIATVKGNFDSFAGSFEAGEDLASSKAYGTIEAASVNTHEPDRDNHLRSADFFDAEQFPQLTFESTSIRHLDDDEFEIVGNLTIHGVTQEITLKAEVTGTETDPWGNDRVGFEITGQIKRSDHGMRFNQALGSGNVVVSDKVKLSLDISAVKA